MAKACRLLPPARRVEEEPGGEVGAAVDRPVDLLAYGGALAGGVEADLRDEDAALAIAGVNRVRDVGQPQQRQTAYMKHGVARVGTRVLHGELRR